MNSNYKYSTVHQKHLMNPEIKEGLSKWIPSNLVQQATESIRRRERQIEQLVEKGNLPEQGWDQISIEWFIQELSLLDSNNYLNNVGGGEREGRVYSSLVRKRNLNLAHGIGRSGDVAAVQPKAAGSSIIVKLTNSMMLDLMRRVLQMRSIKEVIVLPTATGMTLTLCLLAIRQTPSYTLSKKYALWPRMDQKTCLKAIVSAGFIPIIIENKIVEDAVCSDVEAIKKAIEFYTPEAIAVIVTTTSCFSPRIPDDVEAISVLCKTYSISHIINNAYGLQCNKCVHSIEQACKNGRVDAIVQSTDKNFLVPVGGAIVSSPDVTFLQKISQTYPGRACISPILDLFITLLEMGRYGYEKLRKGRIELSTGVFREMLMRIAEKFNERVLITNRNTISFSITLTSTSAKKDYFTSFGSMLFTRGVSGARVVKQNAFEKVGGIEFTGYGSSVSNYPTCYFSIACAIGMKESDITILEHRLNETFVAWKKEQEENDNE